MMNVKVERLTFSFPDDWHVSKFDDTVFYRQHFAKMWQSIKSVDIVAVSKDKAAYFIEVKDYRIATDAGPSELPQIVARKVFDTLAAQLPCKLYANDEIERQVAARVCECRKIIVVLHIEQLDRSTGIFRPYNLANVQQKLRQLLRPIHAHPWVLQIDKMGAAPWTAKPISSDL